MCVMSASRNVSVTISYYDQHKRSRTQKRIRSCEKLVETLEKLAQNQMRLPVGVELENLSKDSLTVGLVGDKWLLIYDDASRSNMRYSMGNAKKQGSVEIFFDQCDSIPTRYLITKSVALEIIREWYTTGELSAIVKWEDHLY